MATMKKVAPKTTTEVATIPQGLARFMAPIVDVPVTVGGGGPYVAIAEEKSGNIADLIRVGINAGDVYLNMDGNTVKLQPFEYHLLAAKKFYTKMDNSGKIVRQSVGEQEGLDEHLVCLMLVKLGDDLIPTRSDFRKTKMGVVAKAVTASAQAASPDWATLSDTHRATMTCQFPFGRFIATGSTRAQTVKNGPNAGMKYFAGRCAIRPSSAEELQRLADCFADPEFVENLESATASFDARVAELSR